METGVDVGRVGVCDTLTVRTFGRVDVIGWGVGVADAVENEER